MAAQLYRRCVSAQNLKMPGFAPVTFTSDALRDFADPARWYEFFRELASS